VLNISTGIPLKMLIKRSLNVVKREKKKNKNSDSS